MWDYTRRAIFLSAGNLFERVEPTPKISLFSFVFWNLQYFYLEIFFRFHFLKLISSLQLFLEFAIFLPGNFFSLSQSDISIIDSSIQSLLKFPIILSGNFFHPSDFTFMKFTF